LTIIEGPLSAGISILPRHCWFKFSVIATNDDRSHTIAKERHQVRESQMLRSALGGWLSSMLPRE
jgi:hypothetical protein